LTRSCRFSKRRQSRRTKGGAVAEVEKAKEKAEEKVKEEKKV